MKFRIGTRPLLSSLFLILSIISAVYIYIAASNYTQLFPALSELSIGVAKTTYHNAAGVETVVSAPYVDNPVGYTGLSVTSESLSLYFYSAANSSDTLFRNTPLSDSQNNIEPVPPGAQTSWNWTISLSGDEALSLASFYSAHNQNVVTHYSILLKVASFLQGVAGTVPFQAENNVTLTPG